MKQKGLLYTGKAKSVYRTDVKGRLIVEFRDDITAFDGGKKDVLKNKGSYNAEVSAFIFDYLEKNGVKTHFVTMLDPERMVVRELGMIPLEVIVRNIAAGSIVRNYPFVEGTKLNPPVIVIDYKDDSRHDPMLNDDLIVALKLATPRRACEDQEDRARDQPAARKTPRFAGDHPCGLQDGVREGGQDDLPRRRDQHGLDAPLGQGDRGVAGQGRVPLQQGGRDGHLRPGGRQDHNKGSRNDRPCEDKAGAGTESLRRQ